MILYQAEASLEVVGCGAATSTDTAVCTRLTQQNDD